MNEEEKEVVELLKHCQNTYIEDTLVTHLQLTTEEAKILLNLVEKQQKEIKEQKDQLDSRYYHSVKLRELEIAIEEDWRDKIRILKEKVEKEMISNPYDFSYMLNELLGE